jgi:hypothetical protein
MASRVLEHVREGANAAMRELIHKVKISTNIADQLHSEAAKVISADPSTTETKTESGVGVADIRERLLTIVGCTHDLCNYTYGKINYNERLMARAMDAACDTMKDIHILADHIDTKSENKSLRAGEYELSGQIRGDSERLTGMVYAYGQHIDNAKIFADHIETLSLQMISIVDALRNATTAIETPSFDAIDTGIKICTKKQHTTVSEIRVLCMAVSKFETTENEQIYVMLANSTAPALINLIDTCAEHHVKILATVLEDIKAMLSNIRETCAPK